MDISSTLQNLRQQPIEQHVEWANTRLPPWVAGLLIVGLAWKLADITWMLVGSPEEPAVVPPVAIETTRPLGGEAFSTAKVTQAHLFGKFDETTPIVETISEDIPKTTLPLTLNGTGASEDQNQAFALIEASGGSKAYFIGDSIPGGATLQEVHMEYAVLKRGANFERLERKTLAESKGTGGTRRVTSRNRRTRQNEIPQANLGSLRAELVANPAKFTDIVRPTPIYNNGKLAGYRVYPGRERQKFIEIGLKPGDLVTAVNSNPLNDPAQGAKIFRELQTASSVNLTVERAGQSMNITVALGE